MRNKIVSTLSAVALFLYIMTVGVFGQAQKSVPMLSQMQQRTIPKLLKGVTLEDVQSPNRDDAEEQQKYQNKIQPILSSLRQFARLNACSSQSCLSARVVFDPKSEYDLPNRAKKYENAVNYQQLIAALHQPDINSVVLGEILDSEPFKKCDLNCYKKRVNNYLTTLGSSIDIWEIGNEVNGEWTGDINESIEKINYAADEVKRRGGMTELTLYYNIGCRERGDKYELDKWLDDYAPKLHAANIDYILLSYYENNCDDSPGRRPTNEEWQYVFSKIRAKFRSDVFIGFGEAGIAKVNGKIPDIKPEDRKNLIKHYYQTVQTHFVNNPNYRDKYVGGYYWWNFNTDMVPYSEDKMSFWQTLNDSWSNW